MLQYGAMIVQDYGPSEYSNISNLHLKTTENIVKMWSLFHRLCLWSRLHLRKIVEEQCSFFHPWIHVNNLASFLLNAQLNNMLHLWEHRVTIFQEGWNSSLIRTAMLMNECQWSLCFRTRHRSKQTHVAEPADAPCIVSKSEPYRAEAEARRLDIVIVVAIFFTTW